MSEILSSIIFSIIVLIAIIIFVVKKMSNQYPAVKALGFKKETLNSPSKCIYQGRRAEISKNIQTTVFIYFNDYSKSSLRGQKYFCLAGTGEGLFGKKEILVEQLSPKLKLDFKNFFVKHNKDIKWEEVVKLCVYGRTPLFSEKSGTVVFNLTDKIFKDQDSLKEALDIAVEAAKEMEKIGNRKQNISPK